MKTYGPISVNLIKKQGEEKIKNLFSLSRTLCFTVSCFFLFIFFFSNYYSYYYYYYLDNRFYCPIRVHFYPGNFYFFSVHFIVNELKSSHFLASEIFVKISPLKSLTIDHPEIRKIFRQFHNSTKFFLVTRFHETNLTAQPVSSSEI